MNSTTSSNTDRSPGKDSVSRRRLLSSGAGALAASIVGQAVFDSARGCSSTVKAEQPPSGGPGPSEFQIACMTLPYSGFSFQRALDGLSGAGFKYVAWGTTHQAPDGQNVPVIAEDAPPDHAAELAKQCRDSGLEPLMMFAGVYPDAPNHLESMTQRIRQAEAGRIAQILTFGSTRGGDRQRWIEDFRALGPRARERGVLIVLKPHGGLTASGQLTAALVREIDDEGIAVNYDAGNVMDYLNIDSAATLADLEATAPFVHSLCIKDHRNWPEDQDCGPGYGEIDHYRLLQPLANLGRGLPLCCENISAPLVPRPTDPAQVDLLARRAREFLEHVTQGLQRGPA